MAAFLLLLLLLVLPSPAWTQAAAADSPADAALRSVSSFSPRQEGSPAEGALLDWIAARVSAEGMHAVPFDFRHSDFEHSFSRCLRVDIPGRSKDTLIIAVPVDAAPEAGPAQDGSVGVALAIDLLDNLKGSRPPLSLVVLFLGAELGDADPYPMGSTLFLRDYQPDYRTAVLYLDLRGMPQRILVRGGARGIVSPYWLMKRSVDSLEASRVPYRLQAEEMQAFRLGVTDARTLITPWLRAGYPAVGLEGVYGSTRSAGTPSASGPYGEARDEPAADQLPALSSFLRGFVASGSGGIPEEWDRHYLLVQAGGTSLIVGETAYIAVLGGTFTAILLFAFIFVRRLRKYVRTLVRNIGAIVPLAALAVLFLAAGTLAARAIPAARAFDELWKYAPLEFLGLKTCAALFLYAALYNPLRRLPFPRNGSFYSAAALLFLLVEIAAVAVFDISFTSYFLWAFVWVFLSTLVRNRWLKLALAVPAPFWGIRGIVLMFQLPSFPLVHILTLSPVFGNLMVAGAVLPFILVVVRLGLLFKGRGVMRRGTREIVLAGILAAAGVALAVHLLVFSPFSAADPQPLLATQTLVVGPAGHTDSTTLGIESPAPVKGVTLATSDGVVSIPPGKAGGPLPLSLVDSPLQVAVASGQFLQQANVALEVTMPSRPRSFGLSVESGEDFVLYDSSFPALRIGPRSYRLLVGAFAPDPLAVQLSLPVGRVFTLTLTAEFDSPLIGVDVSAPREARVATRVRIVRLLEVKT